MESSWMRRLHWAGLDGGRGFQKRPGEEGSAYHSLRKQQSQGAGEVLGVSGNQQCGYDLECRGHSWQ